MVYIREAHPVDGWRMPQNDREGIAPTEPKTEAERQKVASDCVKALKLPMPCLLDGMDNAAQRAWAGWPDRLYVVDHTGKVTYQGEPGPRGFQVKAWEEALAKAVAAAPALKPEDKPKPEPVPDPEPKPGEKPADKPADKPAGDAKPADKPRDGGAK